MFRGDLRCLGCTGQRAGHNQIRSHLETREKLRDIAHFFFTKIGQWTLIIRPFPVRPIGFTVTKEIKLHGNLYGLSHDPPLRPARPWIDLPKANATEKSVSVVSQVNAVRQLIELFRASAAKNDIVGNERLLQQEDSANHFVYPLLLAELFHS